MLDLESINKNVTIISEVFDILQDKEERHKFMEDLLRIVNEQNKQWLYK